MPLRQRPASRPAFRFSNRCRTKWAKPQRRNLNLGVGGFNSPEPVPPLVGVRPPPTNRNFVATPLPISCAQEGVTHGAVHLFTVRRLVMRLDPNDAVSLGSVDWFRTLLRPHGRSDQQSSGAMLYVN